MLELNKEYTYKEICDVLGWKVQTGESKQIQIKKIESCFEFYHPMNKKTHKEKKSYIFTKQLKNPIEPSTKNNGGAHNLKNINVMKDYILYTLTSNCLGKYYSMTSWYCDMLKLMNKEVCNIVYKNDNLDFELVNFCKKHNIQNIYLFCDYISFAKACLKEMLVNALGYMNNDIIEYKEGYIFVFPFGSLATDKLNDTISLNETIICNRMNETYDLSDKLKGRQLLLQIYGNESFYREFNKLKIEALMNDKQALDILNDELSNNDIIKKRINNISCGCSMTGYYKGICIQGIKKNYTDGKDCSKEITAIVCNKVRKKIFKKYCDKCSYNELEVIESLLFTSYNKAIVFDGATPAQDDFDEQC